MTPLERLKAVLDGGGIVRPDDLTKLLAVAEAIDTYNKAFESGPCIKEENAIFEAFAALTTEDPQR